MVYAILSAMLFAEMDQEYQPKKKLHWPIN